MADITDYEIKVELAFPNAKQVKITDLIGDNIVIKDYKEVTGDNGVYFVILATNVADEEVSFANGSKVVMTQIAKAKAENKLPLRTLIKKVKNKEKTFSYYTLSPPEKN